MCTLVKDTLDALYQFYAKGISEIRESEDGGDSSNSAALDESLKGSTGVIDVSEERVHAWKKQKKARNNSEKTDLERYLGEDTVDGIKNADFNILDWWKLNSEKYRVLSIMARDVLAVPVSTVASESFFSTSGRVLDAFRSSLSPRMIEALICSQNWLNLAGLKFDDKDFDQFDSTEKIVDAVFAKIAETQGANVEHQVPMNID